MPQNESHGLQTGFRENNMKNRKADLKKKTKLMLLLKKSSFHVVFFAKPYHMAIVPCTNKLLLISLSF